MKTALLALILAIAGLTTGCVTEDEQRAAIKKEVVEFIKKCNKNPSDPECVGYAKQNTSGN